MAKNTILLRDAGSEIQEKTSTAVTITPGALLELTSGGLVQANSTAQDAIAAPFFALEDSLQGNDIDDVYAVSVIVKYATGKAGARINAIAGAAVAVGAAVESAGNDKLITRTTGKPIGICYTAAAGDNARLEIELI